MVQPIQPQPQHVDRVAVRLPPFWRNNPVVWFVQLEAQFSLSGITTDLTKFNYVLSYVDSDILQHVADFIAKPPTTGKYEGLKQRLINVFSDSEEQKLRKLLSSVNLGDRKPSQLLNEMTNLGSTAVPEELIKTLWLQRLPTNIQSILATSTDTLANLAKMADKIAEIQQPPSTFSVSQEQTSDLGKILTDLTLEVAALKTAIQPRKERQRSRSRNRYEICWYHHVFKNKARKCIQPCKFTTQAENLQPRQ